MVYNLLGLCITLAVAVDPVYNPAGPYRVSPLIENATEEAIYPYLRQGFVWSRDALLEQAAVHGFLIVGGTVAFGDTIETNVPSTGSTPSSVFVETGADGFLQRQDFTDFITNLKAAGLISVETLYGTGTPGRIAKFIQDTNLADSIITEDAGTITIGGDTKITGFTEIQNASAAVFTAQVSGANITDASNQIPQDDLEYVLSELWYRLHNDVKWEYINFNDSTIDSIADVDITGATGGKILKFNSSGVLVVSDDSISGPHNHGTGTPGRIAKFIQDATLADSIISEDAGKITIGGDATVTGFTTIRDASAGIVTAQVSGATIVDVSEQILNDNLEYILSELWYRLHYDVKWSYINFNDSTIDSLSDVDITGATAGKILKFNSSGVLVVSDDALGDTLSASVLDDLGDVTISGVVDQEILSYDSVSGQWINRTKAELGLDTTEDLVDDSVSASELEPVWAGKASGILIRSASGVFDRIDNNSSNWNTAYTDRLKWDGGATGLDAETGRNSLGLGSAALSLATDFALKDHNHGTGTEGTLAQFTGTDTIGDSNLRQISSGALVTEASLGILREDPVEALDFGNNLRLRMSTDKTHLDQSSLIRLQWTSPAGKPAIGWFDEGMQRRAAIVAHHYLTYPTNLHQHLSLETADSAGALQTRLEIPWGGDVVDIETHSANFKVAGGGSAVVTSGTGSVMGLFGMGTLYPASAGDAHTALDKKGFIHRSADGTSGERFQTYIDAYDNGRVRVLNSAGVPQVQLHSRSGQPNYFLQNTAFGKTSALHVVDVSGTGSFTNLINTGSLVDGQPTHLAVQTGDSYLKWQTWDNLRNNLGGKKWDTTYNNIIQYASNWQDAYTERRQWDGGAANLDAETGRNSLGLGTAATRNAEDTLTNGSNLPSGGAVIAYINGRGFMTDPNDSVQGSELDGVFSTVGLLKRTGTAAYTTVPDNSANWNTAYTERLRWDGGATGLNASTGRTSLGLGTAATRNAEDTLTNGANLPDGEAIIAYINGRQFSGPHNHGTGTANYVAKFVGSATIGNSQIYDNGTGVGVGTTVMTEKFNVNGMVYSNGLNLNGNYKISERTYTITTDSPATLLDANGSSLSIGKSYKIEAGISSTSTQTGAVAYLFGNGTYFTLYKIFEAGTSSNHVEIYLEGNTPKIRLYGNSTPYNCTVRLEEFPNRFRGSGPDMYTYTTASGVQRIVASGSDLTYGSITLTGEKGGYAGIAYKNVSGDFLGYFMVDRDAGDNVVGWYDGGWAWYFKDGILNLPQNTGHKINLDGESGKHKLSHSSQSVAIYTDRYVRFHSDTNLDAFVFDCDFGNLTIDGTYYGNGGGLSGVNADTLSGYVHTDFVKRAGDSMYGPLNMGAQKVVFDNSPTLSKLEMGADYKIGLDAYTLVLQTDRDFRIQSNDPSTLFFIDGSANVSNFYTNVAMNNYNILNANKIGGKGLVFTARTESTATALLNALSDGEMVLWKPGGAPLALAVKYGPKDLRWQTLATYSESEKYPNNVYAGAISYGGQLYRVQVDDNF